MGVAKGSCVGAAGDIGGLGPLVWVRRRNGSWWPGRILPVDEVPASSIMSPKSGTPVKLLGREDASVEWYNLEKSIRVKAFRCGEFDACIKNAETSHSAPIKRREKYARREDAILHALELERELGVKQYNPGAMIDNSSSLTSSAIKKESTNWSSEDNLKRSVPVDTSRYASSKSPVLSRRAPSPLEKNNLGNVLPVHGVRNSKPCDIEQVPESISRTKGLLDFGLRIAPAKKKDYQFIEWDSVQKPVDNRGDILPGAGQSIGGAHHSGSGNNSLPFNRKNLHGYIPDEAPAKRRDRHRPLLRLLESSAKLSPSYSFQNDHDVGSFPVRGKRSSCIYLPADSNDSDDVGYSFKQMPTPHVRHDHIHQYNGSLADESTSSGFEDVYSDSYKKASASISLANVMEEEANIVRDSKTLLPDSARHGSYDSAPELHFHEQTANTAVEVGVSKWHLKGKRNIRSSVKIPIDTMEATTCNSADKATSFPDATFYENKGYEFNQSSQRAFGICDEDELADRDTSFTQSIGFCNDDFTQSIRFCNDDSHLMPQACWEADRPSHVAQRTHWYDELESMLVDVELKVRACYQGEHVPLVSLMSRLNGKAIIGHPIQVEIVEDGSSATLVYKNESSRCESTEHSPVWTTAKRTANHRIPRSIRVPPVLEDDEWDPLTDSDLESRPPSKKAYTSHFSHHARLAKKSVHNAYRSATGKFQRKPVSPSGQKIRTLSSLSMEQQWTNGTGDVIHNKGGGTFGGSIRPDASVPLVACVPVKVVFSRILEAVGRPASSVAVRNLVTDSIMTETS